MQSTVTFEWDPPLDSGFEAIVDYYRILITPSPPSLQPGSNLLLSPPWNVTLAHNLAYNVSIRAENCAGQSLALTVYNIRYST